MKSLDHPVFGVIYKTLILPFFIRMAGFFFLLFYLLFGMVPGGTLITYHTALIIGCLNDLRFFLLTLFIWFLYYFHYCFFCLKSLEKPENEFLTGLFPAFQKRTLLWNWLLAIVLVTSPIWIYSFFMIGIALNHNFWNQILIILIFQCGMNFSLAYFLSKQYGSFKWVGVLRNPINFILLTPKKSLILLPFYHLLIQKLSMLAIGKSLSLIFTLTSILITLQNGYDLKVPVLFWIISLMIQSNLVKEISLFDSKEMEFRRNLPYSLFRLFLIILGEMTFLILPEIIIFIIYSLQIVSPLFSLILIFLGIGTQLCFYSMVYLPESFGETKLAPIFILFLILFIMNLYGLWVLMIVFTWLLAGIIIFTQYYKFEWKSSTDEGDNLSGLV